MCSRLYNVFLALSSFLSVNGNIELGETHLGSSEETEASWPMTNR